MTTAAAQQTATAQLKENENDNITFKIQVTGPASGAQLVAQVEEQIYRERVYKQWNREGVPINMEEQYVKAREVTVYSVTISAEEYRQYRAQTEQGAGVELTEENKVADANQRAKELAELPQSQQEALNQEINRRFKEATGLEAPSSETMGIRDILRDEVLAQHAQVSQLSDKVKCIIRPVEEGGILLAPADYPKMIAFIQQVEGLDQRLINEYVDRVGGAAGTLEEGQQSLQRFLDEQLERANEKEKRIEIENDLTERP